MKPELSQRYSDTERLLRGVTTILEYGFGDPPADIAHYLAGKIGAVTARFGVLVTPVPKEATNKPDAHPPGTVPLSAWADRREAPKADRVYYTYAARYGAANYHLWGKEEPRIQQVTREQAQARAETTAQRLAIPAQYRSHPIVQEFIGHFHSLEDLLTHFEQGEVPPSAPGLTPSVADRYAMSAHLLQVGKAILEEGFQGRRVEPHRIATHVTSALSYFGLQAHLQLPH